MRLAMLFFYLCALVLTVVTVVYSFMLGWQCFQRLFEVGGTWEFAKHAFIVAFSCGLSAKVALGIGKGIESAIDD